MDRKEFIVNSCMACLSATALAGLLSSCKSTLYIQGRLNNDGVMLSAEDFIIKTAGKTGYRPFIVVRNEALQYPICVYRFNESDYTALWMQCAHQGAELQASGDYLQCPAHGSEFNNRGRVTNGPADQDLRSFPVVVNRDQIFIDLRKK
jgi:Rieske Fe-S protein